MLLIQCLLAIYAVSVASALKLSVSRAPVTPPVQPSKKDKLKTHDSEENSFGFQKQTNGADGITVHDAQKQTPGIGTWIAAEENTDEITPAARRRKDHETIQIELGVQPQLAEHWEQTPLAAKRESLRTPYTFRGAYMATGREADAYVLQHVEEKSDEQN